VFHKRMNIPSMAKRIIPGDAFTLLELLVVIAVMGVILCLLMPALGKARASSRRVVCRSNLHAIGEGFRSYLNESHDVLPEAALMPSINKDLPGIAEVLRCYLPDPQVFRCPSDLQENYFATEGTSYEYPPFVNGRRVDEMIQAGGETTTPLLFDYTAFHGPPGTAGSINFLFLDFHVGDVE
jgi:prepilin-type N-terminal cleavage/methylation domain-containing protein/prepilin-type processing-associated H-X9-DG protein